MRGGGVQVGKKPSRANLYKKLEKEEEDRSASDFLTPEAI